MRMIFSLITFLSFWHIANVFGSTCSNITFSSQKLISSRSDSIVLITHPSIEFDFSMSAKSGINSLLDFGTSHSLPIVYLSNSNTSDIYSECNPSYWFKSSAGEFSFQTDAAIVYLAGGYWELCQESTVNDIIRSWDTFHPNQMRLIQVMNSIYVSGNLIYESDEFYSRYLKLLNNKPKVDFPNSPTMTLKELIDVVENPNLQVEILKRNLPNFELLKENYKVELYFRGTFIEILKESKKLGDVKKLRIEFIDSL